MNPRSAAIFEVRFFQFHIFMSQHNEEGIWTRSASGARLQRASGVQPSGDGGNRQQLPSGRGVIGNGREMSSVATNSVTTTASILKSSPPPPNSGERVISAEAPSSEDDGACSASRAPRVRPAQAVRFSKVVNKWTYDVD